MVKRMRESRSDLFRGRDEIIVLCVRWYHSVGLRQPADLSFADDVHCLVASDGVQRAVDGSEPLTGDNPPTSGAAFDGTVL